MRSKILSKSSSQAVCDTPIARITGCVLNKDIGRRLPLELQCSYQGQHGDVSQSVCGNPFFGEGGVFKDVGAWVWSRGSGGGATQSVRGNYKSKGINLKVLEIMHTYTDIKTLISRIQTKKRRAIDLIKASRKSSRHPECRHASRLLASQHFLRCNSNLSPTTVHQQLGLKTSRGQCRNSHFSSLDVSFLKSQKGVICTKRVR